MRQQPDEDEDDVDASADDGGAPDWQVIDRDGDAVSFLRDYPLDDDSSDDGKADGDGPRGVGAAVSLAPASARLATPSLQGLPAVPLVERALPDDDRPPSPRPPSPLPEPAPPMAVTSSASAAASNSISVPLMMTTIGEARPAARAVAVTQADDDWCPIDEIDFTMFP